MQLLTDETYQDIIKRSVELSTGKGEILVGAGPTWFRLSQKKVHNSGAGQPYRKSIDIA